MLKKVIVLTFFIAAITVSGFAAGSYNNPPELLASLTNRNVQSIMDECYDSGKPLCVIANEAGKLNEYKSGILEMRQQQLEQRVAEGYISQERADYILSRMKNNLENCDGTGYNCGGWNNGHRHGGWHHGGYGCRW